MTRTFAALTRQSTDPFRLGLVFALVLVVGPLGTPTFAGDATLSWDPNTEPDLAGYTVHYGSSSGAYSVVVPAGLTTSYTVTGLSAGTYYFAVTAENTSGAGSEFSNEVSKVIADTTPPVISAVAATGLTASGATVTWTTNEASATQVDYGTTTAYGASTTLNATLVTAHSAAVSGLQAATVYHYRVRSADAAGNAAVSADYIFTTSAAPDTTPPALSGATASAVNATSAVITWSTNEASSSVVEYGTTTAYGASASNATLVTSHSLTLTSLTASAVYHYRVRSTDAAGNAAVSGDFAFTTSAVPDTTPPVLTSIAAGSITASGATVTWTTNEASATQVDYGTTTAYGASTTLNATLVTAHSAAVSGLQAATVYHYRVRSADAAGNAAVSADYTFTTSAAPDTTGPSILNLTTTDMTPTSVTVTWSTNEPATAQVEYGTTTAYGQRSVANATLLTTHREALAGLSPGATYHVRVLSADAAGNVSTSGDLRVVLPSAPDTTPPQDIQNFSALGGSAQITLRWTNPPDADFAGVQIRFRTDRYPSGPTDGVLLGDFSGNPGEPGQADHNALVNGVTYYYAAASYDRSGNRQSTTYASATPITTNDSPTQATQAGGCGMIIPSGGNPPGPWQAADLLILTGVALYFMMRRRRVPRYRTAMSWV